jgi:D-3-phosphoglycerate dehydrogenase
MKVLISDKMSPEGIQYLEDQGSFTVVNRPGMPPEELLKEVSDASALIVRSKTKVTPDVIEAAKELKVIGRAGAGVDNIDLEAATGRGIVVMNTPGGNSVSAGEHAFALMIALARRIPFAHSSMKQGLWNKSAFMGKELLHKTLGVVGIGKIGSVVAQRGAGFQMKVLAYDPFVSEAYAADLGVELCSLDELFQKSDFISLHLPANEKTKHLINSDTLNQMKDGVFLVNAARGALVNEVDLIAALEEGKLAGAALDVFETEPDVNAKIRELENVVLTPHIAGSTSEAQAKVGTAIAVQISNYLRDNLIVNAVNFPSLSSQEQSNLEPFIKLGEKLGSFIGQISEIRISEIGLRYYGELAQMNYKPLGSYILKAILRPILSEDINQVSARKIADDRGISVVETTSTRERDYSNLISVQLRSETETEWVEGAILHHGNLRLVSVDGIPAETPLGDNILFIRNADTPGVVGHIGTTLGELEINIGSFVLGRSENHAHAVGVVNTDTPVPSEALEKIEAIPAVQFARLISLGE